MEAALQHPAVSGFGGGAAAARQRRSLAEAKPFSLQGVVLPSASSPPVKMGMAEERAHRAMLQAALQVEVQCVRHGVRVHCLVCVHVIVQNRCLSFVQVAVHAITKKDSLSPTSVVDPFQF